MTAVEAKQNNTVPPKPVVPAIKPTVTTEAQEAQKAKAAEKAKETSGEGSGGFSFSFDSNFASYQNAISFLDTRQDIMKGLENALGNSKEDQIAEAKHEENVDRDKKLQKLRDLCKQTKSLIDNAKALMISLLSGSGSTPSSKALVAQQIKELTSQIAGLLDTATNLKGVMVDTDKDLLSTADTIKNTLKDIGDTIKSKTSADTCQVC